MKFSANQKSIVGLIIISVIILTSGYIINASLVDLDEHQKSIQHAYIILDKINLVLSNLQDIETGERGYIITNNPLFLEPYYLAVNDVDVLMKELHDITLNDTLLKHNEKLKNLIEQKIVYTNENIELVNTGKSDQAIEFVSGQKGKILMDDIRQTIKEMLNIEYTLLNERSNNAQSTFSNLSFISIITSVIIIITVIIVYAILDKDSKIKTRNIQKLQAESTTTKEKLQAESTATKEKLQLEFTDAKEKQLYEVSKYARSLIEASLDPLVTISPEGKITDVNEATVKITGVSRENLIDTDFSNYFTEPQKAREGYQRVFKEGSVIDYPLSIKHLSGQIIDVLYNASVYKDDKGNVLGVFAAARDITETKKVSAYARSLIEASLDPLVTISPEGKITDVNEATVKITGVSRENLIDTDFSNYFTEPQKAREGYQRVFKEGSVIDYPLSIKHLSGQIIDVLYNASVYKDDKGNVLGVFAAARDITERKNLEKQQAEFTVAKEKQQAEFTVAKEKQQAEFTVAKEKQQLEFTDATAKEQLARTDAKEKLQLELTNAKELEEKLKAVAKDEFSAMVTHELKTPLVPIIGYCKMFKTSMFGKLNEEQTDAIEVIEKSAKRLETLITDIMDVRKLDLDQMKFQIRDLSLDEFFSNLDSDYRRVLENKGCQFTANPYAKNLVIKTDKARLRQVFDNMISNSIKYVLEKKGKIEVGCMKENKDIVFHVKDNGAGIPLDKQNGIFQKFYQIDTTERRTIGGTGLGLAISKGITEGLGGKIWFESDGKTGTTFYIKFPMVVNMV